MTHVVTPSQEMISAGQIGKIQELLGAALRKSTVLKDPIQQVLEDSKRASLLVGEMLTAVQRHAKAVSNLIARTVTVDRNRTPRQALDATGRKQYTDRTVVDSMPQGDGEEVEVVFFNLGRFVNDEDLEEEYELRGLVPADPYSLTAVNEVYPAFADDHPNGTHWKDAHGKWCCAVFGRWDGERRVGVGRYRGWDDDWWFAGLRK